VESAFARRALLLAAAARAEVAVVVVLDAVRALLLCFFLGRRRGFALRVPPACCAPGARILFGLQLCGVGGVFVFGCAALLCFLLGRRGVVELRQGRVVAVGRALLIGRVRGV
jgi:hypothetical protein